jgi:predicted  nucleic acid-binding Zn-ribbon protein
VIHINKESLEKLIQDVEQQLQKNTERLNHHLSKNERNQILAENQAIENTINKLKNDLKGADDVGEDKSYLLETKEQAQEEWNKAFNGGSGAIARKDENVKENSEDWEAAFSNNTQIGIANKN